MLTALCFLHIRGNHQGAQRVSSQKLWESRIRVAAIPQCSGSSLVRVQHRIYTASELRR